jgi:hypothetical protein
MSPVESSTPKPTSAADNQKARHEEVRIRWRAWVLGLPGGVAWLRIQARLLKWKEQAIGPHTLTWPAPETTP